MAFENYKSTENAETTFDWWIWSTSTTVIVNAWEWALFPTTYPFLLTFEKYNTSSVIIWREIVKVTWSPATDQFTIVRQFAYCVQDETADPKVQANWPQTFASWDKISLYKTTIDDKDIKDEIVRLETDKLDISEYNLEKMAFGVSNTWDDDYEVVIDWISSYINGQTFKIQVDVWNVWEATLNINSLWAKAIKKRYDNNLGNWDIKANQIVVVVYNSISDVFEMVSQIATLPTVDVEGLAEEVNPDDDSFALISKWDTLKKVQIDNFVNSLKKYQLNENLATGDLVQLLDTWKVAALDLMAFSTIDVTWASFGDGYPNCIFKLDDEHFVIMSWYNSSNNYWTTYTYKIGTDWNPVQTQSTTITTSQTSNSSYTWCNMIPMWNNYFVFTYCDSNNYLRCVISEFNPNTWTFTHGSYQTIDDTGSVWDYNNWIRMTDTTLLVTYSCRYIKKLTINIWTKTITTNWTRYSIPNSAGWYWPLPLTSWAADVWAVCYADNVSGRDIYVVRIDAAWHDLTFSEATELYNPWSTDCYIYGWDSNLKVGWDGRTMAWIGNHYNESGRMWLVKYTDGVGFEFGSVYSFPYRNRQDWCQWYDTNKIITSEYDYDGTGNGRYYNIMEVDSLNLSLVSETKMSSAWTYICKVISVWWWFFGIWNNQSTNRLYLGGFIKDLSWFFGILKETWLADEFKKVARYWNISNWHTSLTPWKNFWYGRAISSEDILLYKNT